MSLFGKLFKSIGKIIKPVSKIAKPLMIAGVVSKIFRRKKKKPKIITTQRQMMITPNPYSRWGSYLLSHYEGVPPLPSSPATMQMLKLMKQYIANLRNVANQMTEEQARQIRDVMGARGLLRSGWTAKALGRLPSEVWLQLAPQLGSFMSQVQQAMASDWYSNYLKNLSKWQAGLRWF